MMPERRARSIPPVVIAAVFVMVGLIAFGLLTRPVPGGLPGPDGPPVSGATPTAQPALIVGLTILSPADGQVVGAAEVTVIGTAPPGLSITQDISFGLDQHASVDGTGHWAIKAGLNEGDNKLTFRIGDDRSTERTIHVTYTPQRTP
jgi:Glucodextranase, domain B